MSLSAALAEAYASGDSEGVVLTAAELDHSGFPATVFVVNGVEGPAPGAAVSLPIEAGGEGVDHTPCAFTFVRPGADRDGPTDGRVMIDNVSDLLSGPLRDAIGYNEPIRVTFRQYRVLPGRLEAVTGPDEVIEGLELSRVDLSPDTAEGTLTYQDGRLQNVPTGPDAFFDRENYPGLFS